MQKENESGLCSQYVRTLKQLYEYFGAYHEPITIPKWLFKKLPLKYQKENLLLLDVDDMEGFWRITLTLPYRETCGGNEEEINEFLRNKELYPKACTSRGDLFLSFAVKK